MTQIDTSGFDDSRSDMTDTDILQKIANFLRESAGAVILEEMKGLQTKHDEGMQEVTMANDEDLKAELAEKRQKMEGLMTRAEQDQKRLSALTDAPRGLPTKP